MKKTRLAIVIPSLGLRGVKDVGMKESLPHIGVAYLAANLDREIVDVIIIDCPATGTTLKELLSALAAFQPDIVGFTAMTYHILDAWVTARKVKETMPGVTTIVGGYHVSAVPEETIRRFREFDIGVYGEGERTLNELISAIRGGAGGADLASIPGVCCRENGEVRLAPPRLFMEDLDALKFPAYELMPIEKYAGFYKVLMIPRRTVPISTGRGCPHKCIFCYKATGDKYRVRSVGSVMAEVRRDIREYHIREFVVTDESFLARKDRVRGFCEAILNEGIQKKVSWICQSRVDHADPETLGLMKRAGCRVISYGIEAGNADVLKTIKKGITAEQALNAIGWAKKAGILTDTNFIIGHPGETRETIRETVELSIRLDAHLASYALLVPFPGTEVARMAKMGEGGLKQISEDYSQFGKQVGGALELEGIPRAELERFQRRAYMRFFLRPSKFLNLFRVVSLRMLFHMAAHALFPKRKADRE